MKQQYHAIIHKEEEMWVGQVEEVPGAISQGYTLKELKDNLSEALTLVLECQKDILINQIKNKDTRRTTITVNYK